MSEKQDDEIISTLPVTAENTARTAEKSTRLMINNMQN